MSYVQPRDHTKDPDRGTIRAVGEASTSPGKQAIAEDLTPTVLACVCDRLDLSLTLCRRRQKSTVSGAKDLCGVAYP